ncbi:tripartite tricarboxylate transporter substrate binding protein [soil metagenome]
MNARLPIICAVALAALTAAADSRAADEWPQRPVQLILPAGAGGSSDPLARLLADELGKRVGQSFVVQNRPGAGGNVGMSQTARSKPDGYTIVIAWTGPLATNLALYKDVGWDPKKDLTPIGMVGCTPNVLAVAASSPISNLSEFLAYTRAHNGTTSYGTTGVGSSWHIAGEMVSRRADNGLVHIPYTTPGGALTDLLGGRLQAIFPVVPMTVPHVKGGDMRVLAVFSHKRSAVLPNVPTTVELGQPDLISETCFALLAPTGTPLPVIAKLNSALNAVINAPDTRPRLEEMGLTLQPGAPEVVTTYLQSEIPRQAQLVAASGAKAD